MKEPPFLKASLLSSLISMLTAIVYLLIFLYGQYTSEIVEIDEIDNAPIRSAAILLSLSPAIYLILVMFFYVLARILFVFGMLDLKYFVLVALLFSALLALKIGRGDFDLYLFCMFGVWLSIGAVSWHYFGTSSYNKFKN